MKKLLQIRQKIAQYQEWFYMPFILIMGGLMSFGMTSEDKIYMICFAVVTMLWGIKMVITDYTRSELLWIVAIGALLIANFLGNHEKTLIISFMAIVGAKNVSLDKIFKYSLWSKLVLTVGRVSMALLGLVENEVLELPKNGPFIDLVPVHCYGFYSANILFANLVVIIMLFYLVYRDKIKWYMYFVFTAFLLWAYQYLICRTGIIVWFVFGIMLLIWQVLKKNKLGKEYMVLCSILPFALMVLTFFLTGLMTRTEKIDASLFRSILLTVLIAIAAVAVLLILLHVMEKKFAKGYILLCNAVAPLLFGGTMWFTWLALRTEVIDPKTLAFVHKIFTGRFSHTEDFLSGISWRLLGNVPREPFDSIYYHLLYNYGWVITAVVLLAYSASMWYCIRKKMWHGVIVMGAMSLYGFMELFPLSVAWNIPLLYLSKVLFKDKEDTEETNEKMHSFNKKYQTIETYGFLAINLFSTTLAYLAACYLRFYAEGYVMRERGKWFQIYLLCFAGCLIYDVLTAGYRHFFRRGIFDELTKVLCYVFVLLFGISAVIYIFALELDFSRLMLGYFIVLDAVFTFVMRCLFKAVMRTYYWCSDGSDKVLVVTTAAKAASILENIKRDSGWSYKIIGLAIVDCDMVGSEIEGVPVVANAESVIEVGRQATLDVVIVDSPNLAADTTEEIIKSFLAMGVVCHNCVELLTTDAPYSSMGRFASMPVVTYSMTMVDYRRRIVKRLMDIIGGVVGLLILVVVTPFVALAIKIDSRGPVFFAQTRIGRNGRRFKMYKFRSMYTDAEERKKELMEQNQMQGLMFKMDEDPRITKVGKFIRKTSIDELPQFWNVLKGDMSLVGTRPPTVDEFEQYSPYYRRRLSITPGMTGLWQVSGRSDIDNFDDVVKLDLQYIDEWSVRKDVKILLQTVGVVLKRKGSK